MSRDDKAYKLFQEASTIQFSDPCKALDLLMTTVKKYPDTLTVRNYVIDTIITISTANSFWEEAIAACALGQELKPKQRKSYALEAQAIRLKQEGKHLEATEVLLERATLHGKWYGDIRYYGDEFARMGAHDRAWRLYNEAVLLAVKDGQSPHTVRQSMAKLLLEENKPRQAVEILIAGIWEAEKLAKKGAPKSLTTSLRKALRASGVRARGLPEEIVATCKNQGRQKAIELFRSQINLGEE